MQENKNQKMNVMKNFVGLTFLLAMLLTSCGNSQIKHDSSDKESTTVKSVETGELKDAKNCDEFIEQYETWMDDYLKLLEKYMKNPMDQTLSEQYMKVAQEGMTWMNNWTNIGACASKEKYQKRFDAISEKADKKMKELGID